MELDDLKSAWKDVESHIEKNSSLNLNGIDMKGKTDIKEQLMRRCFFNMLATVIGGTGTVTSQLWAPVLLPVSWLVAFGCFCALGAAAEFYLLMMIRKISIWNSPVSETFNATILIKRYYKSMELYLTLAITVMFVWMSFLPPFAGNWYILLIWIFFAISLFIEFRIYHKNISMLNQLSEEINNDNE